MITVGHSAEKPRRRQCPGRVAGNIISTYHLGPKTKKREELTNLETGRAGGRGLSDRPVKLVERHSQPSENPQVGSRAGKSPDLQSPAKAPHWPHPTGSQKTREATGRASPPGEPLGTESRKEEGGQWTWRDKEKIPSMVVSPEHVRRAMEQANDPGQCVSEWLMLVAPASIR